MHKAANSGILGKTRRGVLHARSALCVRDRTGTVPTTQYHTKLRIGDLREAVVKHCYLLVQLSRRFALSLNDRRGSFGDEVLVGELGVDAVELLLSGRRALLLSLARSASKSTRSPMGIYIFAASVTMQTAPSISMPSSTSTSGRARELLHELAGKSEGIDIGGADIYFRSL